MCVYVLRASPRKTSVECAGPTSSLRPASPTASSSSLQDDTVTILTPIALPLLTRFTPAGLDNRRGGSYVRGDPPTPRTR
ncbi:hypothetical protein GCM10023334_095780 [Nonomuraea thailandensis]